MNRRNFLKLLGLSALPVGLLPARAQPEEYVTDVRHIRITMKFTNIFRVTIDNSAEPALADFDGHFGEKWEDWVAWNFRDINNNFYVPLHSQFFEVSEKSIITVTSPSGIPVTFRPRADKVYGDFMEQVDVRFKGVVLTAFQEPHKIS